MTYRGRGHRRRHRRTSRRIQDVSTTETIGVALPEPSIRVSKMPGGVRPSVSTCLRSGVGTERSGDGVARIGRFRRIRTSSDLNGRRNASSDSPGGWPSTARGNAPRERRIRVTIGTIHITSHSNNVSEAVERIRCVSPMEKADGCARRGPRIRVSGGVRHRINGINANGSVGDRETCK